MSKSLRQSSPNVRRDRNIVLILIVVFLVCVSVPLLYAQPWTGFGPVTTTSTTVEDQSSGVTTTTTTQTQPAKTLWDWSVLLVIPLVLGGAAIWFNRTERQNEQRTADQRAKTEYEIAADRLEEETLQNYLNRMSDLLIHEGLAGSDKTSPVRDVARARTLTTLRRLNGERKGAVIRFLFESDLIGKTTLETMVKLDGLSWKQDVKPVVSLYGADLSGADLTEMIIVGADLVGVDLSKADLSRCSLLAVNLDIAKLCGTNLNHANLALSRFAHVDFTDADLRDASFSKANLSHAIFENAKVVDEQLAQSTLLYGTIMPNGKKYDGRFNLAGDIVMARGREINVDDPEAMNAWYMKQ